MQSTPIPPSWDAAYQQWLEGHREALTARDWAAAFQGYPWVAGNPMPRRSLDKPLAAARIAVISSAGVSGADQMPFDAESIWGDATFRVITPPLKAWQVDHGHYSTDAAKMDYNTVFPLEPVEQLAAMGLIGSVAPEHYSFMGYQPDPRPFYEDSAPRILDDLQHHQVDAALLVPG